MTETKLNKLILVFGESELEFNSNRESDECEHCGETFPTDELTPCAVEPDFHFCEDCADKLRDF